MICGAGCLRCFGMPAFTARAVARLGTVAHALTTIMGCIRHPDIQGRDAAFCPLAPSYAQ